MTPLIAKITYHWRYSYMHV